MTWRWRAAAIVSCASRTVFWSATSACRPPWRLSDGLAMNLAFRLARREMRSGLAGFRLFIACLALGVAAITGILSFSRAVEEGLRADAREILGADVAISLLYRAATPEQIDFLKTQGQLVRWLDSRAMARPTQSDGRPTLVQLN